MTVHAKILLLIFILFSAIVRLNIKNVLMKYIRLCITKFIQYVITNTLENVKILELFFGLKLEI